MNKIISGFIIASGVSLVTPMALACEPMHHGRYDEKFLMEMDSNKDGSVSKKEFDAFHNKHFKEMDSNKDGKLTPEEMQAAHGHMHEHGDLHMGKRFEAADTDHDGSLTREEAKDMPMLTKYFDEIDANKDGKVTQEEMKAMMQKDHEDMPGKGGMAREPK